MRTISQLLDLRPGDQRAASNGDGTWTVYESVDVLPPFGSPTDPNAPPQIVSSTGLKLAIDEFGLTASITAYLATQPSATRIWWESHPTMDRKHPLMVKAQSVLHLTDAQADALFNRAQELAPLALP